MNRSQAAHEEPDQPTAEEDGDRLPRLTTAVKDAAATRELMFTLRHFHLGDPSASDRLSPVGDDLLPALLDPYRDSTRLRYNFPLVLFPPIDEEQQQPSAEIAQSLDEWLQSAAHNAAPGEGEARILKDHLPWIEHRVREQLIKRRGPVDARPMLVDVTQALQQHLQLPEAERRTLEKDVGKLLEQVAAHTQFLGYDRYAAIHLLIHTVYTQALPRRQRLQRRIESTIRDLKSLFEVEWEKSDEAIEPRMARDSIGLASNYFDPAALSAVMDHSRGTHQMSEERRTRVNGVLSILESWQPQSMLLHFTHSGDLSEQCLQPYDFCQESVNPDPCASAMAQFDRAADDLAPLFSALRIADLEIKSQYDPLIHDPWFTNFHWSSFSLEELMLVPAAVALESATQMAGDGQHSLSRLLSSGRPVQILVRVQPHNNPGAAPGEGPYEAFRTELGYLGISHRQAMVTQSSPARHAHLLDCFKASLKTMRTSLHIVNTGLRPAGKLVPLNAWLIAGAAIESRAHPFFRINPEAGDSAADRMDFSENPQAELDWPPAPFSYWDENGERVEISLGFTFADYALLLERLRDHFRIIPPQCDSDALVPVEDYLASEPEQAQHLVPFVWAVDANGILHRLVVSIQVTNGARDRRNFWRALQEMAGIKNRYVERAIEETRAEERAKAAAEIEALNTAHAEEVERIRNQAAGEAMQRLSDMLLGLDTTAPAQPSPSPAVLPDRPQQQPEAADESDEQSQAAEETAEQAATPIAEEPWIDTPLCTSCNDCLKINTKLFIYNEEKQASIEDPHSGTFAQLVEAAELCPAKCIHPGTPLNPDEPGLEALIERAAPFNQ